MNRTAKKVLMMPRRSRPETGKNRTLKRSET
jgi:hypothetical protein